MQEFTSVSVSSYEADALTALLNEKSRDGWDVVAIVPTGSTVTGYLARESTGESSGESTGAATAEATESDSSSTSIPEPSITGALLADTTVVEEPRFESVDEAADTTADAADTGAGAVAGDAADEFPKLPDSGQSTSPVDEPAGWASGVATAEAASESAATSEPVSSETVESAEPAAAASTASAAPAGWYADPSSRYELRYWDGGQWTEHVSRAGQQFTDPPVA
jgi:hypothetical protein